MRILLTAIMTLAICQYATAQQPTNGRVKQSVIAALRLQEIEQLRLTNGSTTKVCPCSGLCECGCNEGLPCDCNVSYGTPASPSPSTYAPYIAPTAGSYTPRFSNDYGSYRRIGVGGGRSFRGGRSGGG